jgi:hypothetical protein
MDNVSGKLSPRASSSSYGVVDAPNKISPASLWVYSILLCITPTHDLLHCICSSILLCIDSFFTRASYSLQWAFCLIVYSSNHDNANHFLAALLPLYICRGCWHSLRLYVTSDRPEAKYEVVRSTHQGRFPQIGVYAGGGAATRQKCDTSLKNSKSAIKLLQVVLTGKCPNRQNPSFRV